MCLSCIQFTDGMALGSIWPFFFMSLSLKCFFSRLFFNEIESVSQVKKNFTLQMLK